MTADEPRKLHGMKAFAARRDAWIESLSSANTRQAYRRDLEVFGAWMRSARRSPLTATPDDLDAFRQSCERDGDGSATVNRRLSALSSFFQYLDPRAGASNPAAATRRSDAGAETPTRTLSPPEVEAVWTAARKLGAKTEALIALVLFDRFKSSELLPLDVDDVTFSRGGASIAAHRGAEADKVRLDQRTADAIRRYRAGRRDGPLMRGDNPTRESARLTRFGVDYLVKRVGQAAELSFPLTVGALRGAGIETPPST